MTQSKHYNLIVLFDLLRNVYIDLDFLSFTGTKPTLHNLRMNCTRWIWIYEVKLYVWWPCNLGLILYLPWQCAVFSNLTLVSECILPTNYHSKDRTILRHLCLGLENFFLHPLNELLTLFQDIHWLQLILQILLHLRLINLLLLCSLIDHASIHDHNLW